MTDAERAARLFDIEPPLSLAAEIAGQLALLQVLLRQGIVPTEDRRIRWAAEAEEAARRLSEATITERRL